VVVEVEVLTEVQLLEEQVEQGVIVLQTLLMVLQAVVVVQKQVLHLLKEQFIQLQLVVVVQEELAQIVRVLKEVQGVTHKYLVQEFLQ
jgi:hypothetical protein